MTRVKGSPPKSLALVFLAAAHFASFGGDKLTPYLAWGSGAGKWERAIACDIIPAFSGVSQDLPALEGAQAQGESDIPPVHASRAKTRDEGRPPG